MVFVNQNGRKMLQFWNFFVWDITSFSRTQWVVLSPWILLRGLKLKVCTFCSAVNKQIPIQFPPDVIVFSVTGITALTCWYWLKLFQEGNFRFNRRSSSSSQKLNIINGVKSGHLNGQEDHSPSLRISVQDFTNTAKEMHHLIRKFGQDLLKF